MKNIHKMEIYKQIFSLVNNNYIFTNKQKHLWKGLYKEYEKKVMISQNKYQLYDLIDNILLKLRDSHTRLFYINEKQRHYDINLAWISEDLYLLQNINGYQKDVLGGKVYKINGKMLSKVLNEYKNKFQGFPEKIIKGELIKDIKICAFNTELKIEIITPSNKIESVKVKELSLTEKDKLSIKKIKKTIKPIYIKKISDNLLYIKILTFRMKEIKKLFLSELNKVSCYKKVIFDVRDNPGGYVNQAKKITALVIPNTVVLDYYILQKKDDKYCKTSQIIKSEQIKAFQNKQIYIIFNENTMSSAEHIFIRALKFANYDVITIGEKTAGVYGQAKIYHLKDGSILQVTTKKYVTGSGKELRSGIDPDYPVRLHINNILQNNDKALEFCKGLANG